MAGDDRGLSFRDGRVPHGFVLRHLRMPAGTERSYQAAEWADAMVVIESGRIEVVATDGGRYAFGPGDIVCLDGLSLRTLCSRGPAPLLLSLVSRYHGRRTAEDR